MAGAALLSTTALMAVAPPALADIGGGTGGGGCNGPCTVSGPFNWKVTASGTGGTAWNKFAGFAANNSVGYSGVRHNTLRDYFAEGTIKPTNGETAAQLLSRCTRSDYIWWVTGANNPLGAGRQPMFTPNYGGTMANTLPTAVRIGTPTPIPATVNSSITNWIANKNAGAMRIVCSFGVVDNRPAPPPAIVRGYDETRAGVVKKGRSYTKNEPHTYLTTVTLGLQEDFVGAKNLHDQPATSVATNFGKAADALQRGAYNGQTFDQVTNAINTALAKDNAAGAPHAKVNLDAANQAGMAEGGVLNVAEQTKRAIVTINEQTPSIDRRRCEERRDPVWSDATKTWSLGKLTVKCSAWVNTPGATTTTMTSSLGSLQNTGFWQMLSVHCNTKGFNALVASVGAKVVTQGDSKVAALAYTKKFAQKPSPVPFGAPTTDSGKVSFYDKECGFTCTPDAGVPTKTTETSTATLRPLTGASSGDVTSNKFIFFRDNKDHPLNVDVWRPITTAGVRNPIDPETGKPYPAVSTTVTRWLQGTPGLTSGENGNGGQFTLSTAGKPIFDPKGGNKVPEQVNFDDATPYSTNVAGKVAGEAKNFTIRGTWASDEGKPNAFNVKWEFKPQVATTVPTTGLGFDSSGNPVVGTSTVVWTGIQGRCVAEFGKTTSSFDPRALVEASTGTGSVNKLDSELIQGFNDDYKAPVLSITTNLLAKFVRATTE